MSTAGTGYRDRRPTTGGATLPGEPPEFTRFIAESAPMPLDGIDWDAIAERPLAPDVVRVLHYMQDVESHTQVFPRTIFSQAAVDDDVVGAFLVCWLYEEGMHGRALARFLAHAGRPVPPRARTRVRPMDRVHRMVTSLLAALWPDFLALHMAWGAVHECTTIHAYRRMMDLNDHPQLNELLRRIVHDEARHFAFYRWQAHERLARPSVQRQVRWIMDRLYVPVGVSHEPKDLARWVSGWLFDGEAGREAAQHVDSTIAKLPGFVDARFLCSWLERNVYATAVATS